MGTQLERAVKLLRESDDLMMYFGGSDLIYRDASILRFRRLYFLLCRELDARLGSEFYDQDFLVRISLCAVRGMLRGELSHWKRFGMMMDNSCDLLPRFVHACSVHLIEEAEHFLEKFHQNQQTDRQI